MTDKIRVLVCGLGPIGLQTIEYLAERSWVELVGVIDINPELVGRKLSEVLEPLKFSEIEVCASLNDILEVDSVDVAVITTTSSVEAMEGQLVPFLERGISVISTCEELSFPWITEPEISARIDALAKENNCAVLGTGVNPGFLMDLLPLATTAICRDVKRVRVERVQDAGIRRLPFQIKVGAGLELDEFRERVEQKTLRHVGLTESMQMIASGFGWDLERTEDVIDPVIAEQETKSQDLTIEAGQATGVMQVGRAWCNGEEVITLVFKAAVGVEKAYDKIIISGDPEIELTYPQGINGDVATCAITVNAVAAIVKAKPGLRTMADIAPVCFVE